MNIHLAMKDIKGDYILNGKYIVMTFKKKINFKGTFFEYSGSLTNIENITCAKRLNEDIFIMVNKFLAQELCFFIT